MSEPLCGEVREWLNRAVSKTVVPLRVPWVRIPPSPPEKKDGEMEGWRDREKSVVPSLSLSVSPSLNPSVWFWRDRLIGMAPRWKRGGSKDLCGFESRSLRYLISN